MQCPQKILLSENESNKSTRIVCEWQRNSTKSNCEIALFEFFVVGRLNFSMHVCRQSLQMQQEQIAQQREQQQQQLLELQMMVHAGMAESNQSMQTQAQHMHAQAMQAQAMQAQAMHAQAMQAQAMQAQAMQAQAMQAQAMQEQDLGQQYVFPEGIPGQSLSDDSTARKGPTGLVAKHKKPSASQPIYGDESSPDDEGTSSEDDDDSGDFSTTNRQSSVAQPTGTDDSDLELSVCCCARSPTFWCEYLRWLT
jgi:hypothetical protein